MQPQPHQLSCGSFQNDDFLCNAEGIAKPQAKASGFAMLSERGAPPETMGSALCINNQINIMGENKWHTL